MISKYSAAILWIMGLSIITFDKILTFTFSGFTIKSYYFLFLAAAAINFFDALKAGVLWREMQKFLKPPILFVILLFLYELAFSPFSLVPKKSLGYSIWLFFDISVVMLSGIYCLQKIPPAQRKSLILFALALSGTALGLIVIIDYIAYFKGYTAGWIGFNQDTSLHWGVSRPHAFAYEPSYLAMNLSMILAFLFSELLDSSLFDKRKMATVGSILTIGVALYILFSRSGWISTTLSLMLVGIIQYKKFFHVRNLLILACLPVAVLLVLYFSPKEQKTRIFDQSLGPIIEGRADSGSSRIWAMKFGIKIGKDFHYLGSGVGGSYKYYLETYDKPPPPFHLIKGYIAPKYEQGSELIMSIWSQLFAESGLPGFILFLCFALALLFRLWKENRQLNTPFQSAMLATCLVFFVFTAHWIGNVARTDIWGFITLWYVFGESTDGRKGKLI